ncbi:Putative anti-sigma factor antagonist [Magnetospira sp. QH-2]|nr:Putative anti-sigma factor antagonist [Magnetospira sp. QH-2]
MDLQHSPTLRKILLGGLESGRHVVVDLGGVSLVDSSALAAFVEAYQKAQTTKKEFILGDAQAPVWRIISLARLDRVLPLYSDPKTMAERLESGLTSV